MYRVRTNNTEFKKKVMLNSRFFPLSHSGNRWSSEVELFGGIFIYCVTKCHVHLRIRIYDASEDKIRCSICCECMLMIKARTCADPDFAFFFPVYRGGLMVLLRRRLYFSKYPEGVQHFPGRFQLFPGGIRMLIFIEAHLTCDFPGDPDTLSPLWIRASRIRLILTNNNCCN